MFKLMRYLFITALVVAALAIPLPVAAAEISAQRAIDRPPTGTTVNPPPLTLDDPVDPPTFDEEDPIELGDGECIL
jgi:hypothetical protein